MRLTKNILFTLSLLLSSACFSQTNLTDTTITKKELYSLLKMKSILSEKNLMLHTLKNAMRKDKDNIEYLKAQNKELMEKINQHNLKLKKSQEKFKIEIN